MADTGRRLPTANAAGLTGFNFQDPANLYTDDGTIVRKGSATVEADQIYRDFAFGIPGSEPINGIEVRVEGRDNFGDEGWYLEAFLSWNGGTDWTAAKRMQAAQDFSEGFGTSFAIQAVGGIADLWGRSWTDAEFSDANFRLRLRWVNTTDGGANEMELDFADVLVDYGAPPPAPVNRMLLLGVG